MGPFVHVLGSPQNFSYLSCSVCYTFFLYTCVRSFLSGGGAHRKPFAVAYFSISGDRWVTIRNFTFFCGRVIYSKLNSLVFLVYYSFIIRNGNFRIGFSFFALILLIHYAYFAALFVLHSNIYFENAISASLNQNLDLFPWNNKFGKLKSW